MAATNSITGDALISRVSNQAYLDNYDAIFGKKNKSDNPTEPLNANNLGADNPVKEPDTHGTNSETREILPSNS